MDGEVKKYKVLLRDDSQGNTITTKEAIIESNESISRLLEHAHILEVLGEVKDEINNTEKEDIQTEDTPTEDTPKKKSK